MVAQRTPDPPVPAASDPAVKSTISIVDSHLGPTRGVDPVFRMVQGLLDVDRTAEVAEEWSGDCRGQLKRLNEVKARLCRRCPLKPPWPAIRDHVCSGRLEVVLDGFETPLLSIYVLVPRPRRLSPMARAFAEILGKALARRVQFLTAARESTLCWLISPLSAKVLIAEGPCRTSAQGPFEPAGGLSCTIVGAGASCNSSHTAGPVWHLCSLVLPGFHLALARCRHMPGSHQMHP